MIWDKSPLGVYSKPTRVIIDGKVFYDRSQPQRLSLRSWTAAYRSSNGGFMIKAALLYSLLAGPLLEGVDIHYPDGRIDTSMHIAFDGSQIISISKAKPKLSDATVIDARGKILIPGIIESGESTRIDGSGDGRVYQ